MSIVYRSYVSEKRNSSYRWLFGGKETKFGFLDGASLFYWFLYRERLSNRKLSEDGRLLWHGNSESEVATLTLFALYFNLASVRFYQAPGNSESQTRTAGGASSRLIHPVKALKDCNRTGPIRGTNGSTLGLCFPTSPIISIISFISSYQ